MRLIVDMNMSINWISALVEAEFDAVHWSSLGKANATDTEIVQVARDQNAIVLTRDLDFGAILAATGMAKPSVVHLCDEDVFEPSAVARLVLALRAFEAELDAGAILTMSAQRVRLRVLPL